MSNGINIALIGASGVVGRKIISLLEKKNILVNNFYPIGSSSVGEDISFNNEIFKIEKLSNFDCSKIDLAIFSAGSSAAREHAQDFVKQGVYVIDLSSEFRYQENIPVVIPEINPNSLIEAIGPM